MPWIFCPEKSSYADFVWNRSYFPKTFRFQNVCGPPPPQIKVSKIAWWKKNLIVQLSIPVAVGSTFQFLNYVFEQPKLAQMATISRSRTKSGTESEWAFQFNASEIIFDDCVVTDLLSLTNQYDTMDSAHEIFLSSGNTYIVYRSNWIYFQIVCYPLCFIDSK